MLDDILDGESQLLRHQETHDQILGLDVHFTGKLIIDLADFLLDVDLTLTRERRVAVEELIAKDAKTPRVDLWKICRKLKQN